MPSGLPSFKLTKSLPRAKPITCATTNRANADLLTSFAGRGKSFYCVRPVEDCRSGNEPARRNPKRVGVKGIRHRDHLEGAVDPHKRASLFQRVVQPNHHARVADAVNLSSRGVGVIHSGPLAVVINEPMFRRTLVETCNNSVVVNADRESIVRPREVDRHQATVTEAF